MENKEISGSYSCIRQIDFNSKTVTKDKEGHYTIIKGSIHQEDMIITNICESNIGASKYIKQILKDLKEEIENNAIVGDLNTLLSIMDGSLRQKINMEMLDLNYTL